MNPKTINTLLVILIITYWNLSLSLLEDACEIDLHHLKLLDNDEYGE
jgi:hypothetical protein